MYKVKTYEYKEENTDKFTKGEKYNTRKSRSGNQLCISTDIPNLEINIETNKLSLAADLHEDCLNNRFKKIDEKVYDSYKDYQRSQRKQ